MSGFQVEWCKDWPDQDDHPPRVGREFASEAEARAFARRVAADSFFGVAMIYPFYRERARSRYLMKEVDYDRGEEVE